MLIVLPSAQLLPIHLLEARIRHYNNNFPSFETIGSAGVVKQNENNDVVMKKYSLSLVADHG
jgi:hypothetical protein